MTLYLRSYPVRRMARRWAEQVERRLPVNVREEDESYVLSAFVPGLSAEDLNIQVLDDVVRIQGEYRLEEEDSFQMRELPQGAFERSLRLPAPIQADAVEADITDGVLTLRLPKAESAKPKKIQVIAK